MSAVPGKGRRARPPGGAPARAVLEILGLCARAGALITGTDAVRAAAREGAVHRVILAEDAAEGQRKKLVPLLEARRIPHYIGFTREELGAASGRAPVSAVGLGNAQLARRAGQLIAALPLQEHQQGGS